jgi:hypothetical protein
MTPPTTGAALKLELPGEELGVGPIPGVRGANVGSCISDESNPVQTWRKDLQLDQVQSRHVGERYVVLATKHEGQFVD